MENENDDIVEEQNNNEQGMQNSNSKSSRFKQELKNSTNAIAKEGAEKFLTLHGVPPKLSKYLVESGKLKGAFPGAPKLGGNRNKKNGNSNNPFDRIKKNRNMPNRANNSSNSQFGSSNGTSGVAGSNNELEKKDVLSNSGGLIDKNKSSGNSLKDKFGLGGKGKNKSHGAAGEADDLIKKVRKIKRVASIAPIVAPILGMLILIIMLGMTLLAPSIILGEKVDEIKTNVVNFGDKLSNFVTGNGFQKSSDAVQTKLKDAEDKYKNANCLGDANHCYEDQLDTGVLLATIHHDNLMDYDNYVQNEEDLDESTDAKPEDGKYYNRKDENGDKITVEDDESISYYKYVDYILGSTEFENPKPVEQGLIYNLVDYKFKLKCVEGKVDTVNQYAKTLADTFNLELKRLGIAVTSFPNIVDLFTRIITFKQQGQDYGQYVMQQIKASIGQDTTKVRLVYSLFANLGDVTCGSGQSYAPYLVRYINYENYFHYISETYIPSLYFNCADCKKKSYTADAKDEIIKKAIEDIVSERNAYYQNFDEDNTLYYYYDDDGNMKFDVVSNYNGSIPVGTMGTGWKQYKGDWASFEIGTQGSSTSMAKIGCYVSSIAVLMANSKTVITEPVFDPGVLASVIKEHGGFDSSGNLIGMNWQSLAPDFHYISRTDTRGMSIDSIEDVIGKQLEDGNCVVVQVNAGGHFIPVVGSDNGHIIVSDVGKDVETSNLSDYDGGIVSLRVFRGTAD